MEKKSSIEKAIEQNWTQDAIRSGDFRSYQAGVMHDWLSTLTLLAIFLVPLFFVLDLFMMPARLLPRFAVYRGISTLLALAQFVIVRRSKPSGKSYLHGYFISLQIGGIIAIMTHDLGGFNSSYYAGLNLIVIGVNLLMPWRAYHTIVNAALILGMYVGINALSGSPFDTSVMVNNLFFMCATAVVAVAINHVRFRLFQKEFNLFVELEKARSALYVEKELVDDRNKSIKSLLDVSGQGFLSFNRDFHVSPEYSKECENIFGRRLEGLGIDELLFAAPATREEFKKGLNLYFSGKFRPEVVFDLLDHEISIGDRRVKADYTAVHESRVMISLTDITEELRLKEEFRRENENKSMLLKVIANRQAFASLNKEAKALFGELAIGGEGAEATIRGIHTLKANAGFLGFLKTQAAAHELEDYFSDRAALGLEADAKAPISRLMSSYAEEHGVIARALGPDWDSDAESIQVPRALYLRIEGFVKANNPDPVLVKGMEGARMKTLSELFGRFPHMVEEFASRMGKRIEPVIITGGTIPVFNEEYENLIDSFAHIVRNMVDHGIELPGIREAKGKSPTGEVKIDIREASGEIVFTFSDDGQGIRLAEVAKKAKEAGLIKSVGSASSKELLKFIFRDNFSTAPSLTEFSGRGVGLAAVRESVHRMRGHIKVNTKKDEGTVITILIPSARRILVETAR